MLLLRFEIRSLILYLLRSPTTHQNYQNKLLNWTVQNIWNYVLHENYMTAKSVKFNFQFPGGLWISRPLFSGKETSLVDAKVNDKLNFPISEPQHCSSATEMSQDYCPLRSSGQATARIALQNLTTTPWNSPRARRRHRRRSRNTEMVSEASGQWLDNLLWKLWSRGQLGVGFTQCYLCLYRWVSTSCHIFYYSWS